MAIILIHQVTYINLHEISNWRIDLKSNLMKNIIHQQSLYNAQQSLTKMQLEISKNQDFFLVMSWKLLHCSKLEP